MNAPPALFTGDKKVSFCAQWERLADIRIEQTQPLPLTILGIFPLVIATGPGSASRQAIGTGVFFGMIVAITIGIIFVPLLFVWVYKLKFKLMKR